ncbi:hypothetical protein [Rhizobium sp. RHZ01]|uniref:hypothetical protein n=1 Tax=Rhizobium sp. RHZ01 TaxID=2769304 RepID=UPI00177E8BA8|nr:hypothetical protein [Rhizobium sp. RHZ01]MBD9449746.1 hypothetical protein [Rhizobium sp. RHZ01]
MTETKTPQLIFALSVARDMAEQEGSPADMLVFLFDQALKEARDKALRRGIVVDINGDSELPVRSGPRAEGWRTAVLKSTRPVNNNIFVRGEYRYNHYGDKGHL